MGTTKEKMSEYLEKAQTLQRIAQGTADVSIDTSVVSSGSTCVNVHVYPLDEKAQFLKDKKGNIMYHKFCFAEWETPQANGKMFKKMMQIQKEMFDL